MPNYHPHPLKKFRHKDDKEEDFEKLEQERKEKEREEGEDKEKGSEIGSGDES